MDVETVTSEHVATEAFPQAKPKWIQAKLPIGKKYAELRNVVDKYNLYTICTFGGYPNTDECWGEGTATLTILGNTCTRSHSFREVKTGRPEALDWEEPEKVARSIKLMNISCAILTSVDRNDLKDMGSIIRVKAVRAVRRMNPNTTMETLIPDFQRVERNLSRILEATPEIISYNTETVRRPIREVCIQARYNYNLGVLKYLKKSGANRIKSGIMLRLGEKEEEVIKTLRDLKEAKVDTVTIGQYLQPFRRHLSVRAFITSEQFVEYGEIGMSLRFYHVESDALVRFSCHA